MCDGERVRALKRSIERLTKERDYALERVGRWCREAERTRREVEELKQVRRDNLNALTLVTDEALARNWRRPGLICATCTGVIGPSAPPDTRQCGDCRAKWPEREPYILRAEQADAIAKLLASALEEITTWDVTTAELSFAEIARRALLRAGISLEVGQQERME